MVFEQKNRKPFLGMNLEKLIEAEYKAALIFEKLIPLLETEHVDLIADVQTLALDIQTAAHTFRKEVRE